MSGKWGRGAAGRGAGGRGYGCRIGSGLGRGRDIDRCERGGRTSPRPAQRGGGGGGIMSTGSDDEGGDPLSPFATTYQRTISIGLTESVQRSNATHTVVHVATPYPMYLSPTTSLDLSANSSSSTMAFPPPPNNPSLHRS